MRYESNPKHGEPWQRGRKGSQCEPEVRHVAQQLLEESVEHETARYAVWQGRPFKAKQHGNDVWHGWPVGWVEVPAKLRQAFYEQGQVTHRQVRQHWEAHQ